ncbi:MAG: YtxH domain-containing protein [Deltaproteobacteria bacterium]|nr:YtxH domain-containing protein [Deltaproteobacteria bacterium]
MNENPGFSGGQVLLALLGGAAAGAVVALLTAPQSGADTRLLIRQRTLPMRDSAACLPKPVSGTGEAAREVLNAALVKNGEAHS